MDCGYLTLSAFCIEYQIHINNSTRHFFKTVIFRILRIFNGLLQTRSVKKYILTEQLQDEKSNQFT